MSSDKTEVNIYDKGWQRKARVYVVDTAGRQILTSEGECSEPLNSTLGLYCTWTAAQPRAVYGGTCVSVRYRRVK
jgi:hypothetical protein